MQLDLYVGPVQIEAWNLQLSDQFGTIRITLNGAGGIPVEGLRFTIGTPLALWRNDRPEVHFLRLVTGKPVTVPVGTYDLSCEGDCQAQHPALSRRGLKVERGELTDVVIDSAVPWSRCRLGFRGAGEGLPLKGGMIVLKHLESSTSVTKLISHFDPRPNCGCRTVNIWFGRKPIHRTVTWYGAMRMRLFLSVAGASSRHSWLRARWSW